LFVVTIAIGGFLSSMSMFAAFGELASHGGLSMFVTLPLRVAGSLLNSALSAFVGSWLVAAYAAIAVEERN
jgi:hypothetical protein